MTDEIEFDLDNPATRGPMIKDIIERLKLTEGKLEYYFKQWDIWQEDNYSPVLMTVCRHDRELADLKERVETLERHLASSISAGYVRRPPANPPDEPKTWVAPICP